MRKPSPYDGMSREEALQEIISSLEPWVEPPYRVDLRKVFREPSWFCERRRACIGTEAVVNPDLGYYGKGAWCCGNCGKPLKGAPTIGGT